MGMTEEIVMEDGLQIVLTAISGGNPKIRGYTHMIWRALSIGGGPSGYMGFGPSSETAIADLYRRINV